MNRIFSIILALLIGLFAGSLLKLDSAEAQKVNPKDPTTHFFQTRLFLPVPGRHVIQLPRIDAPVRIEASVTNIIPSVPESVRPVVLQGVFVRDSLSGRIFGQGSAGIIGECGLARLRQDGEVIIELTNECSDTRITYQPVSVCINMWY